jgi:hypothetical protein
MSNLAVPEVYVAQTDLFMLSLVGLVDEMGFVRLSLYNGMNSTIPNQDY